ncbi:uncharacterized protein BDW43DRAFT_309169 [Aspergillus alliaceus]|uniref:uncharacterized protein n=1 Tax=Petromyces alliaceus TaxID=209559 RepID=UPI0012A6A4E8|nr:uncharacterized protein BDW43DRAFT_309169 [Aspergillus alliaceus]KAB8235840.1 hypothetical protein BDW43DRAFT_309169 [Aspergillus alliaceus]
MREEERLLLQELDDLVPEFGYKYLELNLLLPKVLHGYWTTRMKDVLFKRREPNAAIIEEARACWEPVDCIELLSEEARIHAPPDSGETANLYFFICTILEGSV